MREMTEKEIKNEKASKRRRRRKKTRNQSLGRGKWMNVACQKGMYMHHHLIPKHALKQVAEVHSIQKDEK